MEGEKSYHPITMTAVWTRGWWGGLELYIGDNHFGSVNRGCLIRRKPYRISWHDKGVHKVKDFKTESGAMKALCHRLSRLNRPEVKS